MPSARPRARPSTTLHALATQTPASAAQCEARHAWQPFRPSTYRSKPLAMAPEQDAYGEADGRNFGKLTDSVTASNVTSTGMPMRIDSVSQSIRLLTT